MNDLVVTDKFDPDCARLADRHYPRRRHGNRQFMPPGKTIVIRDFLGTLVFGWSWQKFRWDGERGYYCSIFRNESGRLSSEIILECERIAVETWGFRSCFHLHRSARNLELEPWILLQVCRLEVRPEKFGR